MNLQKKWFGISVKEYLLVFGMYLFLAICYHIAIWTNGLYNVEVPNYGELFSFVEFIDSAGLDYFIKLWFTFAIWWVIFRLFQHWPLRKRLMLHIIGLPFFVLVGQQAYYAACGLLNFGHLRGYGQIWDIFIPILFYMLQFGIFHAYEYYHNNQRNLQLKADLSKAALKSELSALKAQLNPHFLYNVFNTISASVPPEQESTREMIAKLSDLFRYQLKASQQEMVPLGEELAFIKNYLDLEKARFEDRLKVEIDVPMDLYQEYIPPMILQPIVENSVKHGIARLIDGGLIKVKAERIDDQIHFEISDTGIGVEDKTVLFNTGIGLTNTKLRLEKQFHSELKILDNVPQGLKIQFAI